jgi:NodT family efflux transporter outer membrane factor (OMF) lipoprotein
MPFVYTEDRMDRTFPINDEELFRWWKIFNDPFLDQLLEEALSNNFDYRIALERIYQARAQYWIQFTQILPELDGDAQATHYRVSETFATASSTATSTTSTIANVASAPIPASTNLTTALPPIRDFFQIGFDAIWEIDLFGKLRRSADAAYDIWEATADDAMAIKILVLSEVASTYVAICSFQQKRAIAADVIELDKNLLEISKARFQAGLSSEQEWQGFNASLQADMANFFLIDKTLKLNIYSLAILIGREPETIIAQFDESRPIPYFGGRIPSGIPGELLRRRPDIRSAERNLAAATEQIGVAVAALFPDVSLTGSSSSFAANPLQGANIGFSSDRANKLFNPHSLIWGIGGLVTFPVFDFGKRWAGVEVQSSLSQQAYLNYQKTVIGALQEVEQALASYFNEEEREHHLNQSAKSYKRTFDLLTDAYHSGLADFLQELQVKEQWLVSINTLTDSQQNLATDLIAVYKSMGGDW